MIIIQPLRSVIEVIRLSNFSIWLPNRFSDRRKGLRTPICFFMNADSSGWHTSVWVCRQIKRSSIKSTPITSASVVQTIHITEGTASLAPATGPGPAGKLMNGFAMDNFWSVVGGHFKWQEGKGYTDVIPEPVWIKCRPYHRQVSNSSTKIQDTLGADAGYPIYSQSLVAFLHSLRNKFSIMGGVTPIRQIYRTRYRNLNRDHMWTPRLLLLGSTSDLLDRSRLSTLPNIPWIDRQFTRYLVSGDTRSRKSKSYKGIRSCTGSAHHRRKDRRVRAGHQYREKLGVPAGEQQ